MSERALQLIGILERTAKKRVKETEDDDGDELNRLDGYFEALEDLKKALSEPAHINVGD